MTKIICVGELLVDMIGTERGNLEEVETIKKKPGGAPANVAVAASRLETRVEKVATVGKDSFGEFLIQKLKEENVNTDNLRQVDQKTTMAFVSLNNNSEPDFMFYRGADEQINENQLQGLKRKEQHKIVHLGSLPLTNQETSQKIRKAVEETENMVSFDPNLREDLLTEEYEHRLIEIAKISDIVFLSEEEYRKINEKDEEALENAEEIIVSKGEEGAELITKEQTFNAKPLSVNTVDTTGAGDALTGAYLTFRQEFSQENALKLAVKSASLSTTSKGAMSALPTRKELRKHTELL